MKYIILFFSLLIAQITFSQTSSQKTIDSLKIEILKLKIQNGLLSADDLNQNDTDNTSYGINNIVDNILNSQISYFELAVDQINAEQMEGLIDIVQNHKVTQIMRDKLVKELTYFKNSVESEMTKNTNK